MSLSSGKLSGHPVTIEYSLLILYLEINKIRYLPPTFKGNSLSYYPLIQFIKIEMKFPCRVIFILLNNHKCNIESDLDVVKLLKIFIPPAIIPIFI